MRFVLTVDMDNAAFEIDALAQEQGVRDSNELARVLRKVASHLKGGMRVGDTGRANDSNGNGVCVWHVDAGF